MKPKSILLIILIAATGYFSLALLFERYHPVARYGFVMDRADAIERARVYGERAAEALATLPACEATDALRDAVTYVVDRRH